MRNSVAGHTTSVKGRCMTSNSVLRFALYKIMRNNSVAAYTTGGQCTTSRSDNGGVDPTSIPDRELRTSSGDAP